MTARQYSVPVRRVFVIESDWPSKSALYLPTSGHGMKTCGPPQNLTQLLRICRNSYEKIRVVFRLDCALDNGELTDSIGIMKLARKDSYDHTSRYT